MTILRKVFAFGIIPYYQDGEKFLFLLIQHKLGHWAFPKGRQEGREIAMQTAQREFEEETGIISYQIDQTVEFNEQYYPTQENTIMQKTVGYFLARVLSKKVVLQPDEVIDYAWLEYKQALNRLTFSNSKKLLKEARKYLIKKLSKIF